jgi:hypothetical protein
VQYGCLVAENSHFARKPSALTTPGDGHIRAGVNLGTDELEHARYQKSRCGPEQRRDPLRPSIVD